MVITIADKPIQLMLTFYTIAKSALQPEFIFIFEKIWKRIDICAVSKERAF